MKALSVAMDRQARHRYARALWHNEEISHNEYRSLAESVHFIYLNFDRLVQANANLQSLQSEVLVFQRFLRQLIRDLKADISATMILPADVVTRFTTQVKTGEITLSELHFDAKLNYKFTKNFTDLCEVIIDLCFAGDRVETMIKTPKSAAKPPIVRTKQEKDKGAMVNELANKRESDNRKSLEVVVEARANVPAGQVPVQTTGMVKEIWICDVCTVRNCQEMNICDGCGSEKQVPSSGGQSATSLPNQGSLKSRRKKIHHDACMLCGNDKAAVICFQCSDNTFLCSGCDSQQHSPGSSQAAHDRRPLTKLRPGSNVVNLPEGDFMSVPAGNVWGPPTVPSKKKSSELPTKDWGCSKCTYINWPGQSYCEMCFASWDATLVAPEPPPVVSAPTPNRVEVDCKKLTEELEDSGLTMMRRFAVLSNKGLDPSLVGFLATTSLNEGIIVPDLESWTDQLTNSLPESVAKSLANRTIPALTAGEMVRGMSAARGHEDRAVELCLQWRSEQIEFYASLYPWLERSVVELEVAHAETAHPTSGELRDGSVRNALTTVAQRTIPKKLLLEPASDEETRKVDRKVDRKVLTKMAKDQSKEKSFQRIMRAECGELMSQLLSDADILSSLVYEEFDSSVTPEERAGLNGPLGVTLSDVFEYVKECKNDISSARDRLLADCKMCYFPLPRNKMDHPSAFTCNCVICPQCFFKWLDININSKYPSLWDCPLCNKPEPDNHVARGKMFEYLTLVVNARRRWQGYAGVEELLNEKLNMWNLSGRPNFFWCPRCPNGFLIPDGQVQYVACPKCRHRICVNCKKEWEREHENRTCEEYETYKMEKDPAFRRLLMITCPKCRKRYELARGGCMHFTCRGCRHEFCCGCSQPFVTQGCQFRDCRSDLGLHCHCPRNCMSWLRDYTLDQLKMMLQTHRVNYEYQTLDGLNKCSIQVSDQDHGNGVERLNERSCGQPIVDNSDMCEKHWKEYLCSRIKLARIDPADFMNATELGLVVMRYHLPAVAKLPKETDEAFTIRLLQFVRENIALPELQ